MGQAPRRGPASTDADRGPRGGEAEQRHTDGIRKGRIRTQHFGLHQELSNVSQNLHLGTHSCLSIVTPWRPLGSNVGGGGIATFSLSGRRVSLRASSCIVYVVYLVAVGFCGCVAVVAECQREALQPNGLAAAIRGAMRAQSRQAWAHVQCITHRMRSRNGKERRKRTGNRDPERLMARHTKPGTRETGRRERQGDSQEKAVCSAPRGLASGEQTIARQNERPRQENRINENGRGVTKTYTCSWSIMIEVVWRSPNP